MATYYYATRDLKIASTNSITKARRECVELLCKQKEKDYAYITTSPSFLRMDIAAWKSGSNLQHTYYSRKAKREIGPGPSVLEIIFEDGRHWLTSRKMPKVNKKTGSRWAKYVFDDNTGALKYEIFDYLE